MTGELYTYLARRASARIIDGDTLAIDISLGFDVWTRQTLRLAGVDAPETRRGPWCDGLDEGAIQAKILLGHRATDRLRQLIDGLGETFVIHTMKDATEKFGRYLVVIPVGDSSETVASVLLRENLAVPYDRGHRS